MKIRNAQKGNAILEFALGWTLLWMLFYGVYQFGYFLYAYNVLATSVANAAQLGARLNYDKSKPDAFTNTIEKMVIYGDTTGERPLLPSLSTADVNVSVALDVNGMPREVTVSTNYHVDAVFTTFNLSGKPRATVAYAGQVTCSVCS